MKDMSQGETQCQIKRSGKIIELDHLTATISINGKAIKVPASKIAAEVENGDLVCWAGSMWTIESNTQSEEQ
ncbi:hypothetical protein FHS16_001640 [Paenibacillus endophyticus]|uniref:DUF3006 domain-containing protein n=1 Tax=Paenibacillus endophyticus TaxID=1294268 RepID=A0A7W5C7P3_9BACL|nr:hypothetical protein [Paenibacillus endophyticus]MBB3151594.1 hypothetical protein [Paenibacillus endophyticus]